jgi:hypothetical protein
MMTKRHGQPVADGQPDVNNADFKRGPAGLAASLAMPRSSSSGRAGGHVFALSRVAVGTSPDSYAKTTICTRSRKLSFISRRAMCVLTVVSAMNRWAAISAFSELHDRLDQRFRLLTGGSRTALGRQQTLRAAVGWSYSLLTGAEQVLLWRLSVFAGGFDLGAAEAVRVRRHRRPRCRRSARVAGRQEPGRGRARRGNPAIPAVGDDPSVRRRAAGRGRRRPGRHGRGGALRAFPDGRRGRS